MGFNVVKGNQVEGGGSKVDWKGLNEYVVETADVEQPTVIAGILSGVIDLGVQKQEPMTFLSELSEDEEKAEMDKDDRVSFETLDRYYDNGKWLENVRVKRVKVKDTQAVALVVDFPDIMLNKGQFFDEGNTEERPLRMLVGGEFKPGKDSPIVVAKPFALTVRKNDKTNNQWSMAHNSALYKMAVAAKVVKQGEPFLPDNLDQLVGKAFQFEIQIGFNDKDYYFEKCRFTAGLGRGQKAPEIDESLLHVVQFDEENDEQTLKEMRASIKNTMRKATNFEGSKIAEQLGGDSKKDSPEKSEDNSSSEGNPFDEDESSEPDDLDDVDF